MTSYSPNHARLMPLSVDLDSGKAAEEINGSESMVEHRNGIARIRRCRDIVDDGHSRAKLNVFDAGNFSDENAA